MTPYWVKLIPSAARRKIEHRPNLLKVLNNTGWLIGDRLVRLGVGLLVGVWVARYLGPDNFGLMNYAFAFMAIFSAISGMGLNGIVVRDLVKQPNQSDTILGTALALLVIGGSLAYALAILVINVVRPDEPLVKQIVIILGAITLLKATDIVKYWFESQVQSRYPVLVENIGFIFSSLIKVGLILANAPLILFIWTAFGEALIVALGLLAIYTWRGNSINNWHAQYTQVKSMIKDGLPLVLSSLTVVIYMRIDQIMIGEMLGNKDVGIYSAAVRISEVWYFLPFAIVASVFPSIIESKNKSEELYNQRLQKLYDMMFTLSLVVAVSMSFMAELVVTMLYGRDYLQAAPVLSICIWSGISVALSSVHGKWLLVEGLQAYGLIYTACGAVINIILNIYLIPRYGVEGAAWATLFAQTLPMFIQIFIPKARSNFKLMLNSLLAPYRYIAYILR